MKQLIVILIIFTSINLVGLENRVCSNDNHFKNDYIAKKGCCSRHGGVCGCKNGRAKCCDGTTSPTCGC